MKRIILILLIFNALLPTYGQLVNRAHVANYAGGTTAGGNLQMTYSAGDKSASDEIGVGELLAVYPGFIPGNFIVLPFGLKKDSAVLAIIYQATNGSLWNDNTGWLSDDDYNNWKGVQVDQQTQRITSIVLPSNNLQNNFPEIVKNLDRLQTLDVRDNNLKKFPNVSAMPNLTTLAVEKNDFSFVDIAPNRVITNFTYAPQDPYGQVSSDTVEAGGNRSLTGTIPGATSYQWKFDPFASIEEVFTNMPNETSDRITVSGLDYAKMGAYKAVAISSLMPGFEIETARKYVWATTEVFGNVKVGDNPLTTGAEVALFRIKRTGAYDSTRVGQSDATGKYELGKVVLGNFVLKVDPKEDFQGQNKIIQTYYISQDDWLKADTLEVLEKKEGIDIGVIFIPPPKTGTARISGFVESDLPEDRIIDDDGRVLSRRKVKKAACAMRRFKIKGRDEQEVEAEIAYYIETDDEGYFDFSSVEDGKYLINIQFPGIPMDDSSEVEFEIGGDRENQVFEVNALITELGIVIDQNEILYNIKPFIKNVVLYPNPTEDILGINYTVYRNISDLKLRLTTLSGVTMFEKEVAFLKGDRHAEIDLSSLSSGVYFLTFTDKAETFKHTIKVGRK